MLRAQTIADLSFELAETQGTDRALQTIRRALRTTGLDRTTSLNESETRLPLIAIAAEGGPLQQIAEQLALRGMDKPAPTPRRRETAA